MRGCRLPTPDAIDYYFAPMSGYAYLGHARLLEITKEFDVTLRFHPLNMLKVFAAAGSFPPAKYPETRQHHRKADMARWAKKFGLTIKTSPAFWPVPMEFACKVITAAKELGIDQGAVTSAVFSAVWENDLNIGDADDLGKALTFLGPDGPRLIERAATASIAEESQAETDLAIKKGIFGSPTYVVGQDWFFGQDRLDFLSAYLAKASAR